MKSEIHNLRNNKKIVQELGTKKGLGQGFRVGHSVRNRNNNRNIKQVKNKKITSYTYMHEN